MVDFCAAVSGINDTPSSGAGTVTATDSADVKTDTAAPAAAIGPSFEEFIRSNTALANPDLVYEYYSRLVIDSPVAEKEFVLPEKKKLPQFLPSKKTAATATATVLATASGTHT
jgi:hypothetical protein